MSAASMRDSRADRDASTMLVKHQTPAVEKGPGDDVLTAPERALVKDTWNRCLPHMEMLSQWFVQRLLIERPRIEAKLDVGIERAPELFSWLFDSAVRELEPATEWLLREAYAAPPGLDPRARPSLDDIGGFFAAHGFDADDWDAAGRVFASTLAAAPYVDDAARDRLAAGDGSPFHRFFERHVKAPMVAVAEAEARALRADVALEMRAETEVMLANPGEAGMHFYRALFERRPDVRRYFENADMEALTKHFIETIALLAAALEEDRDVRAEIADLARTHQRHGVPPGVYGALTGPLIQTIERFHPQMSEAARMGWHILLTRVSRLMAEPVLVEQRLLAKARAFIDLCAEELGWDETKIERRWVDIVREVQATGTYTHSFEELEHGARVAWRNAPKCIGRITWQTLVVRDRRSVGEPAAIFEECVEHLRRATNGGQIASIMTVFRARRPGERWGVRIWNNQLIRFAAYAEPDGRVLGDPANLELTHALERIGWQRPEAPGRFDLLPIAVEVPGRAPQLFALDPADVLRVPLAHPSEPAVAALDLQWCAVPLLSNFRLEIGGVDYSCAPFNGWFMEAEIARNLFEATRYDCAPALAAALDLDVSSEATLWREQAFLELCRAVIHSFAAARVTLVDHQAAARQFLTHDARERRAGRECPAQWSWITPSIGGATVPTWHVEMRDFHLSPHFAYAADPWSVRDSDVPARLALRPSTTPSLGPLIVFVSETGTAEGFACRVGRRLAALGPRVVAADELEPGALSGEPLVLLVSATFGDGDVPLAGQALLAWLETAAPDVLRGTRYAVLGLGSRVYPRFCAAAEALDAAMARCGGERLARVERACEIAGQGEIVARWADMLAAALGADAVGRGAPRPRPAVELMAEPPTWRPVDQAGWAEVTFNEELLRGGCAHRSTRHIGIDLDATGLSYETCDYLVVHPVNHAARVARLCRRLGLDPGTWFRMEPGAAASAARYAHGFPLARLLGEDLDLSWPTAPSELLGALRDRAISAGDRLRLDGWLEVLAADARAPDRLQLERRLAAAYGDVLELLDALPSIPLDLATLIDVLPPLKPRYYSIASSAAVHPGEARIVATVLRYETCDGRERAGLCSGWLATLAPGDRVRVEIKRPASRIPPDFDGPLLLIGAGSGIAPLYALLEERDRRLESGAQQPGPTVLYFGCRGPGELLFEAELRGWREMGALTELRPAFSRYGSAKAYVQDVLAADGAAVWALLQQPDCRVMVCGDGGMGAGVFERLIDIARRDGGLDYGAAVAFFAAMKGSGRYVEDLWSAALNPADIRFDPARPSNDAGARWLRRVAAEARADGGHGRSVVGPPGVEDV